MTFSYELSPIESRCYKPRQEGWFICSQKLHNFCFFFVVCWKKNTHILFRRKNKKLETHLSAQFSFRYQKFLPECYFCISGYLSALVVVNVFADVPDLLWIRRKLHHKLSNVEWHDREMLHILQACDQLLCVASIPPCQINFPLPSLLTAFMHHTQEPITHYFVHMWCTHICVCVNETVVLLL